jgi:hypothetical protein
VQGVQAASRGKIKTGVWEGCVASKALEHQTGCQLTGVQRPSLGSRPKRKQELAGSMNYRTVTAMCCTAHRPICAHPLHADDI